MDLNRFKNDGRANPNLVVARMVEETEKQIERMTGKKVRLIVREPNRWA